MTLTAMSWDRWGWSGIATTSRIPSIGAMVPHLGQGVAVATQAAANSDNAPRAIVALQDGCSAHHAVKLLLAGVPNPQQRQMAALNAVGEVCVFTGSECVGYAGALVGGEARRAPPSDLDDVGAIAVGDGYAVFGNVLASERVLWLMDDVVAVSNLRFPPYRLLAAIAAGRTLGGDHRTGNRFQSAALAARHKDYGSPLFDLRVDVVGGDDDPVWELAKLSLDQEVHLGLWAAGSAEVARVINGYWVEDPVTSLEKIKRYFARFAGTEHYGELPRGMFHPRAAGSEHRRPGSVFQPSSLATSRTARDVNRRR